MGFVDLAILSICTLGHFDQLMKIPWNICAWLLFYFSSCKE